MLTVCVLLFGDHTNLAKRCLESLRPYLSRIPDVRIGLNACNLTTKQYVQELQQQHPGIVTIDSQKNCCKYPMMRQLFALRELQPLTAWFDDDSYIRPQPDWLMATKQLMMTTDMAGAVYRIPRGFRGGQVDWIEDQPWYKGRDVRDKNYLPTFCTGGFWVIRSEILQAHDWPARDILHRGGDVMLGELLRQQGKRITNAKLNVAINADDKGRESKSVTRGFNEAPVGVHYVRPKPAHTEV